MTNDRIERRPGLVGRAQLHQRHQHLRVDRGGGSADAAPGDRRRGNPRGQTAPADSRGAVRRRLCVPIVLAPGGGSANLSLRLVDLGRRDRALGRDRRGAGDRGPVVIGVARDMRARSTCASPVVTSYLLLPLIGMAEIFSWYTTLTTNFIGSVVEESLWAFTATLMTISMVLIWSRYRGPARDVHGD